MGVSGCGKTTVGEHLAKRMACRFYDGDDYHPQENINKMASGQPLNDDDRLPWLQKLNTLMHECEKVNKDAVLACSALKKKYRETLSSNISNIHFVYLTGTYAQILQRMQQREDHYMKPDMLRSQFDALEEPENAMRVDIRTKLDVQVQQICEGLNIFR